MVDLGSGPGLDAFLAAKQVGTSGRVIGVDMTPEMLERARANAAKAGIANVEFRQGRLESLPVESGTVDAVTSNCVINLVPDKAAVFAEIARVLKPGGRVVVSDIVLERAAARGRGEGRLRLVRLRGRRLRPPRVPGHDRGRRALGQLEILKDEDYLASLAKVAPEEADAMLAGWGVTREELMGTVHSITWRAVKR